MPAIDLRDGACVQLVGGSFADERVRIPEPRGVAERWRDLGFRRLHVVDLDAAMGSGSNAAVVDELLRVPGLAMQVGGGVRNEDTAERLLNAGAEAVVVGTRALEDPAWLEQLSKAFPGRVIVAVDVRDGSPVVRGWRTLAPRSLGDTIAKLDGLPLAAMMVTCVDVEGRQEGPDLRTVELVRAASSLPLIASGGIASHNDLVALRQLDVWAAVVGMALYTGTLDPRATAEEFGR